VPEAKSKIFERRQNSAFWSKRQKSKEKAKFYLWLLALSAFTLLSAF
jgi:hypothetical protein